MHIKYEKLRLTYRQNGKLKQETFDKNDLQTIEELVFEDKTITYAAYIGLNQNDLADFKHSWYKLLKGRNEKRKLGYC